jgi:hypothetical protein
MKTKWAVLFTIAISPCCELFGQVDSTALSKKKIHYFNSFLAGGILGKSELGSGATFSMIHGIRLHRLRAGAGIGLDAYRDWKMLPVFGSVSFDVAKIKNNAFYLQLNAGFSKAWEVKKENFEQEYDRLSGRGMAQSMIGYRIGLHQYAIYIAAGHKFQRITYSYNPMPWSSVPGSNIFVEEDMNRFVVQLGFGFY